MFRTVFGTAAALACGVAAAQDTPDTKPHAERARPGQKVLTIEERPARPTPPSALAILAHPDDEITIAPVLARIARDGGKVTLIYATSGDAGPGSSGLEHADAIGAMREKEGRCATFALGIDEPVFWNLGDGELAPMARAPESAARRALAMTRAAILEAQPDVILTWGPDGGYGHADHRMVSAIVTVPRSSRALCRVSRAGPPRRPTC
jgi:LmbE family N-acetylglucosaminyl deacetylase